MLEVITVFDFVTGITVSFLLVFQPVIGIVYLPVVDQMYTAQKGQGSFLNGEKLTASGQTGGSLLNDVTLESVCLTWKLHKQ